MEFKMNLAAEQLPHAQHYTWDAGKNLRQVLLRSSECSKENKAELENNNPEQNFSTTWNDLDV